MPENNTDRAIMRFIRLVVIVALVHACVALTGCGSDATAPEPEATVDTVTITTTLAHNWVDQADGVPPDTVEVYVMDPIVSGGGIQYAFRFETVSGDTLSHNGTIWQPQFGFGVAYMEYTTGWMKTWIDDEWLSPDSSTYFIVHADTTFTTWQSPEMLP
jgi:hypothetical protein